ncbi:MAG: copper chaperone PCu(A)C [Alphaproteobacteria bacterium]
MAKTLLVLAAVLLLSAAAVAQTGTVEVTEVWARATPGGAENGAAYLTLQSPTADRLTGATSPVADKVELHAATMEGGVMRMREVAAIDLPAGQTVTLKPGGLHIMLVGLKQPLQPGQTVPLALQFEKAGKREVAAAVGRVGAMGPGTHSDAAHPQPAPRQPAR